MATSRAAATKRVAGAVGAVVAAASVAASQTTASRLALCRQVWCSRSHKMTLPQQSQRCGRPQCAVGAATPTLMAGQDWALVAAAAVLDWALAAAAAAAAWASHLQAAAAAAWALAAARAMVAAAVVPAWALAAAPQAWVQQHAHQLALAPATHPQVEMKMRSHLCCRRHLVDGAHCSVYVCV
jgi:hypothetical protein